MGIRGNSSHQSFQAVKRALEGYIAREAHGVEIGKAAFGPGFVIAAILDWAVVCKNERGFFTINSGFMIES